YERVTGGAGRQPPPFDFSKPTIPPTAAARLHEEPALPPQYRYMVGARGGGRALERLTGAARARAPPPLAVRVEAYPGVVADYVRDEWRDGQRELLERESRRLGFHFLNTYPDYMDYLKRYPKADFAVSDVDGHPNALAHSINAEAIFKYLVDRQLI